MPATLLELQQSLHHRVNDLRSIERLTTTREFEVAYGGATEVARREVNEAIARGDKAAVQRWLASRERDETNVEELTVKELRRLAASLGIAGYQTMSKASLLSLVRGS